MYYIDVRYYSNSKFASLIGVSRQAVGQAIKTGLLENNGNGIDITSDSAKEYASRLVARECMPQYRDAFGIQPSAPQRVNPDDDINDLNNMDKASIDKLKSIEMIRKHRFENALRRSEYVARSMVDKVFRKLYSIDTSEFAALANNAAPEIASICGIDDAEKIVEITQYLEGQVYRTLDHIKHELNDFLKEIKSDEIR